MRYKPGQKVIISEYCYLLKKYRNELDKLGPPYVATILKIETPENSWRDWYIFKEIKYGWYEGEVEGLYVINEPITSRFEILDL